MADKSILCLQQRHQSLHATLVDKQTWEQNFKQALQVLDKHEKETSAGQKKSLLWIYNLFTTI